MRRRLVNILALPSLLLCAVLAVMWVAAQGRPARTVSISAGTSRAHFFVWDRGGFYIVTQEVSQSADGSWNARITGYCHIEVRFGNSGVANATAYPDRFGFGGRMTYSFVLSGGPNPMVCSITYRAAGLPFWLLCALTAVAPVAWLVGYYRRGRAAARRGVCRRCGYDLRATPDRCPECGTAVTGTV